MNGLDKITARIERDAVADAARIAEEAKLQCDAIRAEGEAKAQERYWRRINEGVKATEDRVQRLGKAADMESRKVILSTKQEIVDEVFKRAEEKLRAFTGEEYEDFLAGLAARAAVTGREEIVLAAADQTAYGAAVQKKANALLTGDGRTGELRLAADPGDFSAGLVLRDGNISVNCTVEALMTQAREEMASFAAAELFG